MSDLSDLFYWTHLVCYRQFCQTHVYYCRQVQPQCADDDDEIILGIIALVGCKGRMMIDIFDHTHWKSPRQKLKFSLRIDIFPIYFEFFTP